MVYGGVIYGGDLVHYDYNHFFEAETEHKAIMLKLKLEKMLLEDRLAVLGR